mgnify:CR=1 FL=1
MIKKTLIALTSVAFLAGCTSATKSADIMSAEEVAERFEEESIDIVPGSQYKWTLEGASVQEQMALKAFQDRGITDRLALATLMGNLKHESQFKPDICEGGARVPYEQCGTGGFGLIQWTTVNRYDGLGRYAKMNECNPSTTECQLGYLFTEYQWKKIEGYMKTPGKSIEWYMQKSYIWLGWGIHGHRTDYAYDYARWMTAT